MKKKAILVTGGTGFLGSHLAKRLCFDGYKVIIIKRAASSLARLEPLTEKFIFFDLDKENIRSLFLNYAISTVIHCATDYGRDAEKPMSAFLANEVFPMDILEAAFSKKVRLFFNIDTFFSAKPSYSYLESYSLSKRHFQEWGHHYADMGRIGFLNLRLFHVYGPQDSPHKFVPTIISRCLNSEKIDLTDGFQKRDFIHVDDVVTAILSIVKAESHAQLSYRHYDIGTGNSLSIRDFSERVKKLCGGSAELNFGAAPLRKGEFSDAHANVAPLRALGWMPKIGIEEGIQTVINDIHKKTNQK